MEAELNELIQAWKICTDGSVRDQKIRQNAFNYIETFKQNSSNILDIGFYLTYQKDSFELSHFGLQLITHTIKFKWNGFNDQTKCEIKNKLMNIIINLDENTNIKGPSYLKNSMCLVIIELIKREWPQNWPNLIPDLFEISNKSIEHKKLIFIILKYMSEEFIDSDGSQTIQLPPQRRKDINQYLNQYMETIFYFYLDCLEYCFDFINKNEQSNLKDIIELANTCLDSLSTYINWININYISLRNYSIINICLSLLSHEQLGINSAKCLIGLSSRKGTINERKPLLGMFSDAVLAQLINCIKLSIENAKYKKLFKYLVQILVSMGTQLNFLWQSNEFDQRPSNLNVYLNACYELLLNENRLYSIESIQLWNCLLSNEFLTVDKDVQQYVILISQLITNSYLLFKFNYSTMYDEFDSEEEFNKFFQKYRTELARLIRFGSSLNLDSYFNNSFEWSLKIFNQTSGLDLNDESGYDSSSFLYLCWDALIFLWTNLVQVMTKKSKSTHLDSFKSKLINLIQASIQFKSLNPNYCSFNYSFMSCILKLSTDLCDPSDRDLLVKTIFEKLYTDLILFKEETNKYSNSPSKIKCILNLRRQITALLLNVCKNYSKVLYSSFEALYKALTDFINNNESTQMEKSILVQALIYLSNESDNYQIQLNLIKNFLGPILQYFESYKFNTVESFVMLTGLNEPLNQTGVENRKLIFYYINCLYGILKCVNLIPSNSTEISSMFINLLEHLINLLKCFNMLHSISSINKDFLDMSESAKNIILGMHQEKHGKNQINLSPSSDSVDQADKTIMFIYNTYDTLNQLIGLYISKFKQELLLIDLNTNPVYTDFCFKFGESIFSSFNQLPNFRMRYLIRYILKSCLTSINFEKDFLNKNLFILKLNEILLEYFLPAILARINETNKLYSNLKQQETSDLGDSELKKQIIEENQFTLMCRDIVDLLKSFLSFAQPSLNPPVLEEEAGMGNEDGEMMLENVLSKDAAGQISDLAIYLLKKNKIIYQSVILCLFDGLNWPDSYCCARLVRLCQMLIDKYPILDQPPPFNQFGLYLSEQISERIFTYCLTSLQTHGEHQEIASLLITLSYSIYEKSPMGYKFLFNKVLNQVPGLNKKIYDEFIIKFNQPQTQTGEKTKKDLFKKIIQPIVGKNIGQLYKYDIQIRVLEPLNLNSVKEKSKNDGTNGTETNICSLFDPNY